MNDKIQEYMEAMRTADSEPTKPCVTENEEHDFKLVIHADGRESFTNLFHCENCGEYIKITQKRDMSDPLTAAFWGGDEE